MRPGNDENKGFLTIAMKRSYIYITVQIQDFTAHHPNEADVAWKP